MMTEKNKGGRPSEFKIEIFDDICGRIAEGESLNKVTREKKYPDKKTFYKWTRENNLLPQYKVAKEDRADTHSEEMVDIADEVKLSTEDIQKAKLRIETRKWLACKLHPRNYGERSAIEHSGEIKQPNITFTLNQ